VGDKRSLYRVLVVRRGATPLGRPKRMWDNNNNKINPQEVVWGEMDWIALA
jgi:hypothetical protein